MSDDDEFDIDFVNRASRMVKSNWVRNVEVENEAPTDKPNVGGAPSTPDGKKSNCVTNPNSTSPGDSDVSLTPPNSPTGTTPRQPLRSRGVRGANRTNKTKKALAKLKRTAENEKKPSRGGKKAAVKGGDVVVEDGGEVSSDLEEEEEEELEMKVKWKTGIIRVTARKGEKAGKVMDRLAEIVGLKAGGINLYCEEDSQVGIGRETLVDSLGLTVASVLYGRARVVLEGDHGEQPQGSVELRLQTRERRSPPVIVYVEMTDKMALVVDKYVQKTGLHRDKVKLFFDGEQVDENETVEDMDLEGGECIDVHIVS